MGIASWFLMKEQWTSMNDILSAVGTEDHPRTGTECRETRAPNVLTHGQHTGTKCLDTRAPNVWAYRHQMSGHTGTKCLGIQAPNVWAHRHQMS